jgi:integrase/recombinase XerC
MRLYHVRDAALLALWYYLLLRVSEARSLRLRDFVLIDGDRYFAARLKGGASELYPVVGAVAFALDRWLKCRETLLDGAGGDDFVFIVPGTGQALSRKGCWQRARKLAQRVGVQGRVHPHIFRHSRARHLNRSNYSLSDIRAALNHSSVAGTSLYVDEGDSAIYEDEGHRRLHVLRRSSEMP